MADKRITELGERSTFDQTCQVPLDDGTQTFKTTGEKMFDFFNQLPFLGLTRNLGLAATASAGALTISLKQIDASTDLDTPQNSRISAWFRSNTLASGARNKVIFDAPISLVVPSGATLGFQNGADAKIYVYLYYDGTNKGIAVSSKLQNEKNLFSLVAIDTASDADSIYADAARSNAALISIGAIQIDAITTAGTWTTPTSIFVSEKPKANVPYRMEVFTSSGTYNKKPNVTFIKVTVVGGGGGGGSTQTTAAGEVANGGCGGGGGASIKIIQNTSLAATETVTIGAAGSGGTAGSDNAGTGGTSSFGSHASATGGSGGSRGTATNSSATASGGDPGEGSGGDINIQGESGMAGRVQSGSASLSNKSGGSFLGGGIRVGATSAGSQPSSGYGNGGSAATSGASTTQRAGGSGRAGIVIVEEWYI